AVARLRAAQAAGRAVDRHHRLVLQVFAVEVTVVGQALPFGGGDGPLDQLLRRLGADLFGVVQRDQDGGVDEAGRVRRRLGRAGAEVVVAPAAVHRLEARQHVVL